MRRRFVRRIGLFVVGFFVVVTMASALAVALLSRTFGEEHRRPVLPVAIVAVGLVVAGVVATMRLVRRFASPVGDVMDAADRVAEGDYAVRVEPRGPGETRRLARAFNQMTERLGSNETRRRELLADVAHELRTPLSVIRGNLEGIRDGLYPPDETHLRRVIEETAVMSRLLDDLQLLSTAEAGALRLYREQVDPAVLVEDAIDAFRAEAAEKGVTLEAQITGGIAEIDVDAVRIGEVLSNLLSNAVRHTPPGGRVTVRAEPAGDGAAFEVSDTGPGIDPEELPHVFDRFVKSTDSGGAGLGLAIAKSLVEAHGGTISAAHADFGKGTVVRFSLRGSG
jgi:two-component system OmpR family sensor kinase/two-component system sensor histidine kinase BaeS